MNDLISRQALLEEYDRLHVGEPGRARKMIEDAPSVQPEQYTKKELETFLHALSLRLLSLRSAQHWSYDDKRAEELKFLSHLYKKVEADMRGKQNEH